MIINETKIEFIKEQLLNGKIIAFPTETVFGLGIIFDNQDAFDNLISLKRRPADKPFTIMCSDIKMVHKIAKIDDKLEQLILKLTPGPITFILPKKESLPDYITQGKTTVGIRIPKNTFLLTLIASLDKPLLVPSANISGLNPCLNVEEIIEQFDNQIEFIIAGQCQSNIPSTIVQIIDNQYTIVRQGEISEAQFLEIWRNIYG